MSINLYMVDIFAEQYISRRRKPVSHYRETRHSHTLTSHGPAAYSNDFICQFNQQLKRQPSRQRRRGGNAGSFRHRNSLFSFLKAFKQPTRRSPIKEKSNPEPKQVQQEIPKPRKAASGFSFPLPSLMTAAVIAGTVVISLVALGWEGFSSSLPGSILQPGSDGEGQRKLAAYAGLNSLGAPRSPDAEIFDAESGEIPLDVIETFEWIPYQVQKGETVSSIAEKYRLSMGSIIASNNMSNAQFVREGEMLRIPNMDGIPYTVKKGDTFSKIAAGKGIPQEVILDTNDIRSDDIKEGDVLFLPGVQMAPEDLKRALGRMFTYPVRNRVTSPYGWRISPITGERHYHAALDLAGAIGLAVKATSDGTVSNVGVTPTFGKFIILSHDGGYQSMYAHLSVVSVKQGQRVNQGAKIGEVGDTGQTTGPHLHFALYKNGRPVNPLEYLK